ncbi:[FeFe] hydrogenase H-cluster maturation GTPase HydF [Desulfomonile tiedjei]|uniref:Iron-only hydrogenase maturation protein HydF n=1 Tax=Desulfomonile tiedjei (strain ATCC 49306 / DSM 6799 / DCB-1) TaxID=706587 RepID=I4CDW6_DESTA|nr:[FeFe] hydrogenase H-cluster maturation GTPase HydF [Desulfomonile tiedjei]AFM27757.1 iron-only hydrogenase maturation protein HydF [Desulfomonile tiedjei DSM 6799]
MNEAPRGVRLVIAILGRRNAGKSSLINAIIGEEVSIVSDVPGTTTDPVAKHYELLPIGPATFYDTAGLDDFGELGRMRVKASRKILWRADIAVLVTDEQGLTEAEKELVREIKRLEIPLLVVFNKTDLETPRLEDKEYCASHNIGFIEISAKTNYGISDLREALISMTPPELKRDPMLVGDLIREGDTVVCVVPIDLAAPKGRLILPQVQVLREILDCDGVGVIAKERELEQALLNLKQKPSLVITDSQVILKVAADVAKDTPLTTFSTLFARFKGDLTQVLQGAATIDILQDGDRILMSEGCSHHVQSDDIGRVKIPRWITQYTGKELAFYVVSGHDFPEDLEKYRLVVHCGACMLNRTEMIRRINECKRRAVAITNYGIAISKVQGVLDRVIAPFLRQ